MRNYFVLVSLLAHFSVYGADVFSNIEIEPTARYRFQDVGDPTRGDAQASTLKLRLNAKWEINDNWRSFIQFDAVHAFNQGNYNSVTVRRATSPILDPEGNELNQLFIHYQSDENWAVKLGRQSFGFDNERQIAKIEFWQHDQTFDALSFEYQDNINWSVNYVYLNKVQRVFGPNANPILSEDDIRFSSNPARPASELGTHDHHSHLFNAKYFFSQELELGVYAYLLDNKDAKGFSSDTYGVRLSGEVKPSQIKYGYTFEYAQQSDSNDSPWLYDTDYLLLETSAQYKSHKLMLSYEKMGEDNSFGFATFLGNNHKFLGWADVFSNYRQRGGLIDIYSTYRGRDGKLRWRFVLHRFKDVRDGVNVGNELDIEIAYRYTRKWEFKFIAAKYFADEGLERLPVSQYDLTTWSASAAYNF